MFLTFQLGQAPVVREQFVRRLLVCFCEMALLRKLSGVFHIVSASIYGYSFQRELEEIKCLLSQSCFVKIGKQNTSMRDLKQHVLDLSKLAISSWSFSEIRARPTFFPKL